MAKIWKATYRYLNNGQECDLGLHYQFDGDTGSNEPDAQSVAGKIDTHLQGLVKVMIRNTGTLQSLIVREEVDPVTPTVPDVYELPINLAGTATIGTVGTQPNELVPLFHRKSHGAVKGGQSWCFGPSPLGGANIVAGSWDNTTFWWDQWTNFAAALDDVLNYGGPLPGVQGNLRPVCYARTRRKHGVTPYTFNVTAASVHTRPRWLRSRA